METSSRMEWDSWQSEVGEGRTKGHINGYSKQVDGAEASIHFLHGNGFAVKTYSHFLNKLDGFNFILQDAAGHGESSPGDHFIGWNASANRFLHSLAEQKGLMESKMIGMGHSFGGGLTVLMNDQNPQLFDKMVLLDPAIFPPRLLWIMRSIKFVGLRKHMTLAKRASRRRTQWESFAQVKANFFERGTFKGWEDECLEDYIHASIKCDEDGHYQLGCPPWMEAEIFSTYPKGLWRAVKNISIPTYILQGKDTEDFFKEGNRLAAKLNPNIKVIELEGGHCFMQQNTTLAADAVMKVLKESE